MLICDKQKCRRIIKYLIIFLVITLTSKYITNCLDIQKSVQMGMIASITFAILDMLSPEQVVHIEHKNRAQ